MNNEIITQKDLNDFLNFIRLQYSREFKGKELEEKVNSMRGDLLERLIEDKIVLAQAQADKIVVEPSRVKAKINEVKKNYPSESAFARELLGQGLVQADLENKIREQMLMFGVIDQKVRSKIVVWPEEITNFYKQNKREFLKPEERVLKVIILQDLDPAKTISYQMRLGSKIEDLATKYLFNVDSLTVSRGKELRSEIEDVVFKLGIGEVSEPVKIGSQYYIFKLEEIIGSQQLSLEESQGRIQAYLFEKKMQEALDKWLDELKKQSYIKILEN